MDSNCYDQSDLPVLCIPVMNKRMEQNIYRDIKKWSVYGQKQCNPACQREWRKQTCMPLPTSVRTKAA